MYRERRVLSRSFSKKVTIERSLSKLIVPTSDIQPSARAFSMLRPETEGPRGRRVLGGCYVLGPLLATGGMSTVHLAEDRETGEQVAVKVALPHSDTFNRSIRQEARILSMLSHPNIVRFIDSGTYEGNAFIVTEYLRGKELHDMIAEQAPLSWQSSIPTLLEICDTLQYIHGAGFVHGDVKPDNIMLLPVVPGDTPGLKLVDFGMARFARRMRQVEDKAPERIVGTVPFMAPEQFYSQKSSYDKRTDIYSFGVTMYFMFTGINPFQGPPGCEDVERMVLVVNHEPDHPSDMVYGFPIMAGDIIMRAIAKDPNERFQTIAELREAIVSCEP